MTVKAHSDMTLCGARYIRTVASAMATETPFCADLTMPEQQEEEERQIENERTTRFHENEIWQLSNSPSLPPRVF
jgi:hypothetical protein